VRRPGSSFPAACDTCRGRPRHIGCFVGSTTARNPRAEISVQLPTPDPPSGRSSVCSRVSSNGNALEGWTAGRWQVERRLRRGKVADAFKVRGPEGEGRVLRLLHPVHVVDARAIARCLDEAKALLYPPHPEIVPVEDAGQLPDGRVYLVAEDSELPLHLDLHPQPRPDELVRMAEQLAPALDALHARSLLHGHLEVDSLVGEPLRLSGVGFGVFQGGTTQEWTGGRDPGRRVDLGLLGRLLLGLTGDGAEWSGIRSVLERCTSVDDALPFPSVAVFARALRAACVSDGMAETRHMPGPPPSLSARVAESVPASVGPYRVLGLLGEGAMGRVFRAERDGRSVALKLLRREHLRSRLLLDRFFREARAVSRIRHPHIVQVLEVGEERGPEGLERAYCVMELLEGKTLGALFRERSLDLLRTVDIACQVCEALEAAQRIRRVTPRLGLGQAARLRHRQAAPGRAGDEPHPGDGHRHTPLHGSGAGERCPGRRPHRPLRPGSGPLRAARRSPSRPGAGHARAASLAHSGRRTDSSGPGAPGSRVPRHRALGTAAHGESPGRGAELGGPGAQARNFSTSASTSSRSKGFLT